jgi:predicted transcriptional regulator of viral defense system
MNKLVELARSGKRVFSAQDLSVIWGYSDENKLFELIKYNTRKCNFFTLARGLYSIYDYTESEIRQDTGLMYEIANKLEPNSYISLYTVLAKEGLIHQYYDRIFSIAKRSFTRKVKGVVFEYKRVKDSILMNDWGITSEGGVRIASVERAVLDSRYVFPKWEIENIERVNQSLLKMGGEYVEY